MQDAAALTRRRPSAAAALSGALFATLAPAENRGTLALTAGTASLSGKLGEKTKFLTSGVLSPAPGADD